MANCETRSLVTRDATRQKRRHGKTTPDKHWYTCQDVGAAMNARQRCFISHAFRLRIGSRALLDELSVDKRAALSHFDKRFVGEHSVLMEKNRQF